MAMTTLENSRQELFCLGLVEGKTANQAYADAGYSPNAGNATRLKGNERIAARVADLQARALNRHDVTMDSVSRQLQEDRELAHRLGQAGAAVSASMGQAKLYGLLFDKVEHVGNRPLKDLLAEIDGHTRGLSSGPLDTPGKTINWRAGHHPPGKSE